MEESGDTVILDFPMHYRRLKLWPCSFTSEPSARPGFEKVVLQMLRTKYGAESYPDFVYHLGASNGKTLLEIRQIFPEASYVGFFRSPRMAEEAREFCFGPGFEVGGRVQVADLPAVQPNSLIVAKLPDMPVPRRRLLKWLASVPTPYLVVLEVSDMFGQGFLWSLEALCTVSMKNRLSVLQVGSQKKKELPLIYFVISSSPRSSTIQNLAINCLLLLVPGFPVLLQSALRFAGVLRDILVSKLLSKSRFR